MDKLIYVRFLANDPNNPTDDPIVLETSFDDPNTSFETVMREQDDYDGRYAFPYYMTYKGVKYTLWGVRDDDYAPLIAFPVDEKSV